jgi:hypothetical protein
MGRFRRLFVASLAGLVYLCAMILSPLLVATWDGGGLPPKPWWFDLLFSVAVLGFAGVPVAYTTDQNT